MLTNFVWKSSSEELTSSSSKISNVHQRDSYSGNRPEPTIQANTVKSNTDKGEDYDMFHNGLVVLD